MQKANWQVVVLGCALAGCSANARDEGGEQAGSLSESARVTLPASEISAVGLDCSSFNSYTASLATATVDCMGTIRPDSFQVTAEGFLKRNFSSCAVDATRLSTIDSLLSLQQRAARLPHVQECMAGRYADFLRSFAQSGVLACPTWSKEQTVNPITPAVIDGIMPALAALDDAQLRIANKTAPKAEALTAGGVPDELEEKNLYRVSFPTSASEQAHASAADWAAACAGGFAGFVLSTAGSSALTDPAAWLSNTIYPNAPADPYLRGGFYFPMSYYGGAPGVQFADAARARPCDGPHDFPGPSVCPAEMCSYYAGIHLKTTLQLDCLNPNDWSTCVSFCGSPL
jgi:hypothetical protein